jgi:chromosome segregation ATPase
MGFNDDQYDPVLKQPTVKQSSDAEWRAYHEKQSRELRKENKSLIERNAVLAARVAELDTAIVKVGVECHQYDQEAGEWAKKYKACSAKLEVVEAEVQRLQNAIWPGLPKWEPTPEKPQQDFHEAVIESLRQEALELKDASERCEQMDRERDFLHAEFAKLRVEAEEARVEIHNLKVEVEAAEARIKELENVSERMVRWIASNSRTYSLYPPTEGLAKVREIFNIKGA